MQTTQFFIGSKICLCVLRVVTEICCNILGTEDQPIVLEDVSLDCDLFNTRETYDECDYTGDEMIRSNLEFRNDSENSAHNDDNEDLQSTASNRENKDVHAVCIDALILSAHDLLLKIRFSFN